MPDVTVSPLALCLLVVVVSGASSLLPMSPVEPWLVGVGAVAPGWLVPLLVVLATTSCVAAKTVIFLGARRFGASYQGRARERLEQVRARVAGSPRLQRSTLLMSSFVGFPPLYLVTALCGTCRCRCESSCCWHHWAAGCVSQRSSWRRS